MRILFEGLQAVSVTSRFRSDQLISTRLAYDSDTLGPGRRRSAPTAVERISRSQDFVDGCLICSRTRMAHMFAGNVKLCRIDVARDLRAGQSPSAVR